MRAAKKALLLLSLGGAAACTDDALEATGRPTPMTIAVDPLEFLGEVPCAQTAGAMQSFVATVTDRTSGFVLASSPPVGCTLPVGFEYVIEGHVYSAEVDGYDVPPSALTPVGGAFSGSRTMQDPDGQSVSPRWTTTCGEGEEGAAVAQIATITVVGGCEQLEDGQPDSGVTAVTVDPSAAAAALGCAAGSTKGSIDDIRVAPLDPALPAVTLACDGSPVTYKNNVEAGQHYAFQLWATAPGSAEPRWGAACFATAHAGVEVIALCDALTDSGAIVVDPEPLWSAAGLSCPTDLERYSLSLTSETDAAEVLSVPCGDPLLLSPLQAGDYTGTLSATDQAGEPVVSMSCAASVPPGGQGELSCAVIP